MGIGFGIMYPSLFRISFLHAIKAPFTHAKIYVYAFFFLIPGTGFSRVIGFIINTIPNLTSLITYTKSPLPC